MGLETALIVTTFNSPRFLEIVFRSILLQTVIPNQIIVADDGSDPDTRRVVVAAAEQFGSRLVHVWQPDTSFRAARIRNLAIQRVRCQHVVFIDGDCVLPPHFIEKHQQLSGDGVVVSGGRVLMTESETSELLADSAKRVVFRNWKFISLPLGLIRDLFPSDWKVVRTCNLGCDIQSLRRIGGFDESYVGWGKEDSDLIVRLIRAGARIRSGRFATSLKHLHHFAFSRSLLSNNERRFSELLTSNRVVPSRSCIDS